MEYNTQRPKLIISEYGRNIQNMVEFACDIKDREERIKVANAIINVMGMLNPQLRDVEEFKHKLWTHLFLISDYKLDVDSPYPIQPKETFKEKPAIVPYPQSKIRYGHYGKTIPLLIKKCCKLKDEKERKELSVIIATLMKRAYLNWNRNTVDDTMILVQLKDLSDGKLVLEDVNVLAVTPAPSTQKKRLNNSRKFKQNKYHKRPRRN